MTDPKGSGGGQNSGDEKTSPAITPEMDDVGADDTAIAGAQLPQTHSRPALGFLRELDASERVTAFFAFCSLVVACGSLAVAFLSFRITTDNRDIKRAIGTLSDLATATKKEADINAAELVLLRQQGVDVGSQTRSISRQANALSRNAAIAAEEFRVSRNQALPRLIVNEAVDDVMAGKPARLVVTIVNSSQSTAYHADIVAWIFAAPYPPKDAFSDPSPLKPNGTIDLHPGTKSSTITHTAVALNEDQAKLFRRGDQFRIYDVVRVTFKDQFGAIHHTNACTSWVEVDGALAGESCTKGNYTD